MIDYDPHSWWSHFFDIKGSMVREILGRVSVCVAWSAAAVLIHREIVDMAMPAVAHTVVGPALGLLLVFRTNSSYDRFWEGRKLWGAIVNETRNVARQARAYLKDEPELVLEIVRWAAIFPYACMNGLRDRGPLGPAAALVDEDEAKTLAAASHAPSAVALKISEAIAEGMRRGRIDGPMALGLESNLIRLIDDVGGCERIKKTPLPFAYVVHLRRALVVYVATLPFALVADFGWWTVAATFLVAYVFFGIEEIGVEIEGPFGFDDNDLPLEAICATIQDNLVGPRAIGLPDPGVVNGGRVAP